LTALSSTGKAMVPLTGLASSSQSSTAASIDH
jgi:hypothetical protein